MSVLGVDGCRGGWVAARLVDGAVSWPAWTADVRELLVGDDAAVAIDVPIGLPDDGLRDCDVRARALLGRRAASVFAAPTRPVLECASYAEARALLAGRGGRSMSAQAFGIVAAVRQVDAALTPADCDRVVEAHPEVAFAVMGGGPGLPPKRTADGAARRIELLGRVLSLDVHAAVAVRPRRVPLDDALDALACAWVALCWSRGTATVLGDGSRDARGLPMRIVTGPLHPDGSPAEA